MLGQALNHAIWDNPWIDVSWLIKVRRSTDFKALKLILCRLGSRINAISLFFSSLSSFFYNPYDQADAGVPVARGNPLLWDGVLQAVTGHDKEKEGGTSEGGARQVVNPLPGSNRHPEDFHTNSDQVLHFFSQLSVI